MKNITKGKKAFIVIGIILAVILLILDASLILYAVYPQQIDVWVSEMRNNESFLRKYPIDFLNSYAPHKYFGIDYDDIGVSSVDHSIENTLLYCKLYYATYIGFHRSESYSERGIFVFRNGDGEEFEVYSRSDSLCSGYYSHEEVKFDLYDREYESGKAYLLLVYGNKMPSSGYVLYFAPLDGEFPYIDMHIISEVSEKDGVKTDSSRYDATYFGAETKYVTKDEFVSLVREYQDKLIEEEREKNKGEHLDTISCG